MGVYYTSVKRTQQLSGVHPDSNSRPSDLVPDHKVVSSNPGDTGQLLGSFDRRIYIYRERERERESDTRQFVHKYHSTSPCNQLQAISW